MSKKAKKGQKKSEKPQKKYRKYALMITKILLFSFLLLLIPGSYILNKSPQNKIKKEDVSPTLPPPPPFPQKTTNISAPFVSAQGVLVMDIPSGVILYQKNPNVRFSPASTTKIVTALVAFDYFKLDDMLEVRSVDKNEATMGLVTGEKLTLESLLYGLLVKSANDAALTIAENYPAGVKGFVSAMNEKAKSLGLKDTHFQNPMGFDDTNHYTTAAELGKLARLALKNPILAKIVATRSITVSDVTYTYFHELRNINQLLGNIPGVAGIKTGFTENAEECLIALIKRNDTQVLVVILKSRDRFGETASLIDWVYRNHAWVDISTVPLVKDTHPQ